VVANLGSVCAIKTSNLKCGSWDLEFLPINTGVTRPSKSTPTEHRYVAVTRDDKERWETTKNDDVLTKNDKEQ
jgi:hypothetical protein